MAAGLATSLVFGHATNNTADNLSVELAAATIGIGGRGDPNAANIPNKLNGNVLPPGFDYIPVVYPAGFDIDNSVAAGVPVLQDTIEDNADEDFLLVVGYSEGAFLAEEVRRDLDPADPDAPSVDDLLFVMIASPNVPNGGISSRFPGLGIPFIVTSNGAAQPSPYDTTYVTNEYDPYADFPAYFNPFSLANSLAAVQYVHPDQYYDSIDYDPLAPPEGQETDNILIKTVTHTVDGREVTDTYVFVRTEQLPLLAPVRQVGAATGTTFLTEPVLSGFEPVLRLLVDMGYTDRDNLNPEVPTQFSLITPPDRIIQTVFALPGAITLGASNFVIGILSIPGSIPSPLAPESPSIAAAEERESLQQESLVGDTRAAAVVEDASPPTDEPAPPTDERALSTEPSQSAPEDDEPTVDELDNDGNKFTPNDTSATTVPRRGLLTQINESVQGLLGGNKTSPATPNPSQSPTAGSSPAAPATQGQESESDDGEAAA